METAAPSPAPTPPQLVYPDSLDSSPRSRHSWDSPPSSSLPPLSSAHSAKLRLMCSYGGHIVPRPHDRSLCYLGGTTRIVVVDRNASLSSLSSKLSSSLLDDNNRPFSIKYQLPNEDLDSLISVSTDEDLDNMIEEYDRILANSSSATAAKSYRLRIFLFPPSKSDSASSIGSLLDDSKSETWFVDALNGAGLRSDSSVNCLLSVEDDAEAKPTQLPDSPSGKPGKLGEEIQSVPDSPMVDTTSSFGSTSSASCLSNLPPIRVREDGGRSGLEESFYQMNVGCGSATTILPYVENTSRGFSDDERLEQGMMGGMFKKPPQIPASQPQQKQATVELPTDAVYTRENSDSAGVISRQKAGFYQDSGVPVPTRERVSPTTSVSSVSDPKRDGSDPNYRIPVSVQDPGYYLQEQQQFIHATPHYIHHHATGPVPMSPYYQMHHPQLQQQQQQQQHRIDQQYPMYFVPVGQNQAYNLPMQSNSGDPPSIPSTKPIQLTNPSIISSVYKEPAAPVYPAMSAPPPKPELAANIYRTAASPTTAQAPLIHISDQQQQQQQYMGYHQLHHPSQSAAAAAANFTYEFTDPMRGQVYYTQQTSTLAPQYQTVSSGVMISEIPLPSNTTADAKQNRTSQQPL